MVSRSAEGDNAAEFLRGSSSDPPGGGDLRGGWNHWMERAPASAEGDSAAVSCRGCGCGVSSLAPGSSMSSGGPFHSGASTTAATGGPSVFSLQRVCQGSVKHVLGPT